MSQVTRDSFCLFCTVRFCINGFILLDVIIAGNDKCGRAEISFFTDSDPCITNELKDETILGLKPDCHLTCEVKTNLVKKCGDSNSGNRLITNGVYFIFRMMATMALASCFILLDAQTIQMCNVEEKRGKKGAYGRQILYKTLAQVMIIFNFTINPFYLFENCNIEST